VLSEWTLQLRLLFLIKSKEFLYPIVESTDKLLERITRKERATNNRTTNISVEISYFKGYDILYSRPKHFIA
jgi:hypothetical protein